MQTHSNKFLDTYSCIVLVIPTFAINPRKLNALSVHSWVRIHIVSEMIHGLMSVTMYWKINVWTERVRPHYTALLYILVNQKSQGFLLPVLTMSKPNYFIWAVDSDNPKPVAFVFVVNRTIMSLCSPLFQFTIVVSILCDLSPCSTRPRPYYLRPKKKDSATWPGL